ncbi:hypothetical protein [Blastococcus sp. TF02A-30]|uniref:hypothetical protein n=1 Tax=Blastococcus sp. TF02A-30 TaxID=2250580 RepID=UPI000DEABF10|nr:hypothetical protein [Blastococcus sp. TF02A-30]RBY92905.1 hypothetical protein DQ241_02385 [Blastococcus sp. TF02A-30]
MPTSVRVAVIAMAVLAGLNLLNAGLTAFIFDAWVEDLADRDGWTRDQATRTVVTNLVVSVTFGVLLALPAAFLPRRQPWARWMGLAASAALGLLTLFTVLAAGGITIYSLLTVVLTIAAVTSLSSRTTKEWVPSLRAGA